MEICLKWAKLEIVSKWYNTTGWEYVLQFEGFKIDQVNLSKCALSCLHKTLEGGVVIIDVSPRKRVSGDRNSDHDDDIGDGGLG